MDLNGSILTDTLSVPETFGSTSVDSSINNCLNSIGFINNNSNSKNYTLNGDLKEEVVEKIAVKSSSIPENTKLKFYEMMHKILRHQLDQLDQSQPIEDEKINSKKLRLFPSIIDSNNRAYLLQPSFFPLMYPTVFFTDDDDCRKFSSKSNPFLNNYLFHF